MHDECPLWRDTTVLLRVWKLRHMRCCVIEQSVTRFSCALDSPKLQQVVTHHFSPSSSSRERGKAVASHAYTYEEYMHLRPRCKWSYCRSNCFRFAHSQLFISSAALLEIVTAKDSNEYGMWLRSSDDIDNLWRKNVHIKLAEGSHPTQYPWVIASTKSHSVKIMFKELLRGGLRSLRIWVERLQGILHGLRRLPYLLDNSTQLNTHGPPDYQRATATIWRV